MTTTTCTKCHRPATRIWNTNQGHTIPTCRYHESRKQATEIERATNPTPGSLTGYAELVA